MDRGLEAPPEDRDGLYQLMLDRISDMVHDIGHSDFSDWETLARIDQEVEMRRSLGGKLEAAARGAYTLTQESEVIEAKRTDLRLASVRGDRRAVIELKLSHRWTLKELEAALTHQLEHQYLRHQSCRAGCLLITDNGAQKSCRIGQGLRHTFDQLISRLQRLAAERTAASPVDIRMTVVGLPLRPGAPAGKSRP